MVNVNTANELRKAVKDKEHILITNKKLIKRLKPLIKVKAKPEIDNKKFEGMSNIAAGSVIAGLSGLAISVAITLIITVGVVCVVAILCNYRVKLTEEGHLELEPA